MNEQLSNLSEEEKQSFAGSYAAYRAKVARDDDTSVVKSRAYSMGTSYTFLIATTSVVEGIGGEVKPSTEDLEIIDASGKPMAILGTIKMFIDN